MARGAKHHQAHEKRIAACCCDSAFANVAYGALRWQRSSKRSHVSHVNVA